MSRSRWPCPGMSRRRFLSSGACAGCAAGAALLGPVAWAAEKPKVRLVFCETTNNRPIWPNIGYDFDARRKQVVDALARGCPAVEFLPMRVMEGSKEETVARVLQGDAEVDGYVVCIQGLGWRNDVGKLCSTGKPTLLVDNLFGGSGLFLTRLRSIVRPGKPVDWVSSSNDQDIAASAQQFTLLKQGKTAADVAAAFRATRRARTPKDADWTCEADEVPAPDFDAALKRLREIKLIVVGGGSSSSSWAADGAATGSARPRSRSSA